jgi:lincosamide nucleotidyltransferase A/C/D/E
MRLIMSARDRRLRLAAVRLARRGARWLTRSPAARLLRTRAVSRLRRRLLTVRADDVLTVVQALEQKGVPIWLAGGWGVDALLGRQTRAHHDVDVIVSSTGGSLARSLELLDSIGFHERVEGALNGARLPTPIRLRDRSGCVVDLIPTELATLPFSLTREGTSTDCADGLFAVGTIDGWPVPCLSVGAQLALHQGFVLESYQRRDLDALCTRFHIAVEARHP